MELHKVYLSSCSRHANSGNRNHCGTRCDLCVHGRVDCSMEQLVVTSAFIEYIFGKRPEGVQCIITQFQIDEYVFCIIYHFTIWNGKQIDLAIHIRGELSIVSIISGACDDTCQYPVVCSFVERFAQNVR